MSKYLLDFRYAYLAKGKDCMVVFWQVNPLKGNRLERERIRINKVPARNRERYGHQLCDRINRKLDSGWNYWVEKFATRQLQECINQFLEKVRTTRREITYRSYESRFRIFMQWLEKKHKGIVYIHQVNEEIAEDYFQYLLSGRKNGPGTYNNALIDFRTLWKWFIKKKLISENVWHSLEFLTEDEKFRTHINRNDLRKLFDFLKEQNPSFYILCGLCYYGLIRRTEMCKLQLSMFDWENQIIRIDGTVSKMHKKKIVVIPDSLLTEIIELKYHLLPADFFLVSTGGKPGLSKVHPKIISDTFLKYRKYLKLPASVTFYSLKDTGNTHMEEFGVTSAVIRDQAGWKNLQQRSTYTHATKEALTHLKAFKFE